DTINVNVDVGDLGCVSVIVGVGVGAIGCGTDGRAKKTENPK
ncbi:unnamed protein product, partial [Rotaria sordida]